MRDSALRFIAVVGVDEVSVYIFQRRPCQRLGMLAFCDDLRKQDSCDLLGRFNRLDRINRFYNLVPFCIKINVSLHRSIEIILLCKTAVCKPSVKGIPFLRRIFRLNSLAAVRNGLSEV